NRMEQFSPTGRIGETGEISSSILFLASRSSSYINGAIIPVDGGWSAW
ncbi:MAG TPA: SDR family oxidoreductase, partial [Dehalococcoidia bacterium]|nr:SDR family oxidoreductase [Dehalococcoidia bacterium]